jgi:large subunit ribosomal protein L15
MVAQKKVAPRKSILSVTDVRPAKGAVKERKRVGRGRASGMGKTSSHGHNGQGQRSGEARKRGFEGGQMPTYRRLPKIRTFPQPNKQDFLVLNLRDLDRIMGESTELTYEMLAEQGLLKHTHSGVRLLGMGEVTRKFTVSVSHISASAEAAIESAGGKVNLI